MENITETAQQNEKKEINIEEENLAIAPGKMRVIKRNGSVVSYEAEKIAIAITKAFLAVEGGAAAASTRIHNQVNELANSVTKTFQRRMPSGGTLHIEEIQDQVELELMRSGEQKVARTYVLYREERKKIRSREEQAEERTQEKEPTIKVVLEDGKETNLDVARLRTIVKEACENLEGTSKEEVVEEATKNLYDGMSINDVRTSLVMTARTLVEKEPNYTYVTARILLDNIRTEALTYLELQNQATQGEMKSVYPKALKVFVVAPMFISVKLPEPLIKKLPAPFTSLEFTSKSPPSCGVVSSTKFDKPLPPVSKLVFPQYNNYFLDMFLRCIHHKLDNCSLKSVLHTLYHF